MPCRRLGQDKRKEVAMKWGGYNGQASERLSKVFAKFVGKKGVYYLMMLLALGVVLGAGVKWHG